MKFWWMKSVLILIVCSILFTSCDDKTKPVTTDDEVTQTIQNEVDYHKLGQRLGVISLVTYNIMKGNEKYNEYTSKMEDIYAQLKNKPNIYAINGIAMELINKIKADKLGEDQIPLLDEGIIIATTILDRLIKNNVNLDKQNEFIAGFVEGVGK